MWIEFQKWHACKNDFILIWANQAQYKNISPSLIRNAQAICDRRSGIGADGIIILSYPTDKDIPNELTIINSDGGIAQTCGNGIRCAALSVYQYALSKHVTPIESVSFTVQNSIYVCQFLPQKKDLPLVQVNMGTPILNEKNSWHQAGIDFVKKKLKELKAEKFLSNLSTCSIGNQHLIFVLDQEEPTSLLRSLGEALQVSPHWDGINVSFVSPLEEMNGIPEALRSLEKSEAYKVFVWERGAGETMACGSAACAISASLLSSELIPRSSWIPTLFPGGWLFAKQDEAEEDIILCG